MSHERVAVTGGNGRIGSAILEHLNERGFHTINMNRRGKDHDIADEFVLTDLVDGDSVHAAVEEAAPDAVIHMGTIPGPSDDVRPHVTYESNVMSSFLVLEAAQEQGIDAVALPSSINVMGAQWQDPDPEVFYLPVDEDHPLTPREEYGVAKHAMETTAAGVARADGPPRTVSSLRYPWVGDDDGMRELFVEPDRSVDGLADPNAKQSNDVLFSYLHYDDAAAAARLAIEADFEGHEAFWIVAADTSAEAPSEALAAEFYPDAERRRDLSGHESLVDTGKAERLLGWTPERSWREL